MPSLGLGTFRTPPEQTVGAVEAALSCGYRLVDTAAVYGNERSVGEAIRASGIDRAELFVTSKLWLSDYGYDEARRGFDASLRMLGLEYLDLYLLHWPVPSDFERTIAAYGAVEQLLANGLVRAIGVSNFTGAHLQRLGQLTDVVPAVNQVELHPFFAQPELRRVHERLGIVTQAWAPIGGVYGRNPDAAPAGARSPLEHPTVVGLAAKHGKTAAQVVLRWHLQLGNAAVPKSARPERILENVAVFDFALADDEMHAVDAMDRSVRAGGDPDIVRPDP